MLIFLNLIKGWILPLALLAVAGGMVWGYGYKKYREGFSEGEKEGLEIARVANESKQAAIEERRACLAAQEVLKEDVKREQEKLRKNTNKLIKDKEKAVQDTQESFRGRVKRLLDDRNEMAKKLNSELKPDDTVTAPPAVRMLHDRAISDYGHSSGEGENKATGDSGGTAGKVETFEASAVAKVLTENIQQYNELAARCDALVDLVTQIKEINKE